MLEKRFCKQRDVLAFVWEAATAELDLELKEREVICKGEMQVHGIDDTAMNYVATRDSIVCYSVLGSDPSVGCKRRKEG